MRSIHQIEVGLCIIWRGSMHHMEGWSMHRMPLKLKGRLYSAFVHSVLLYNSEVWIITETEMKALVGRNGY